ncbi:hypothetical protein TD95_001604 [Thielaviopsis punctulata]|uniref:Fcf2 pre-rRNA processing C-terminal domain-containing protein n=1 Tax=Thielaviopsis punctulata TaxID=72032 RepID=A0A0F4ZG31_9PEZI|nr:hypothetical protein TD95_001604 [Thielaviopsis punctulata]
MTEPVPQPDIESLLAAAEARLSGSKPKFADLVVTNPATAIPQEAEGKKEELAVREVESAAKKQSKTDKADTAGPGWYDLPKTNLTPELKRDLQLLRLRNALDPKVHYKKQSLRSQVPRYSHVGEVIAGPTEFFSKLTKKEKQNTFAQEILAKEKSNGRFKAKYGEIQVAKTSGRKAYYKKVQATRRGK